MSWVGGEFSFDYSMSRKEINDEVMQSLAQDGASSQYEYIGTFKDIRFLDFSKVFFSEAEARQGIRKAQGNRDENIAVPYYDFEDVLKKSKELQQLEKKASAIAAKIRAEQTKSYPLTLTSKFLSCRKCDSKLNREYLLQRNTFEINHCPLCDGDLRPEGTLKHIADLNKSWEEAKENLQKAESEIIKKLSENPGKYASKKWLVNAYLYIG